TGAGPSLPGRRGRQHAPEGHEVDDADLLLSHFEHAALVESREQPAHGLDLEAKIAPDLVAGHAQDEVGARIAATQVALGQVDQERGEPLLRAHRSKQQHYPVIAYDFAREHQVQAALQRRYLPSDLL